MTHTLKAVGSLHFYLLLLLCFAIPRGSGAQEYHFDTYTSADGLPGSEIYAVTQDAFGYLWIGAYGGGISKFDGLRFVNYNSGDGLADNRVLCVFADSRNNIWVGTYGGGVSCFDGKNFRNFSKEDGLSNNFVYSIIEDDKGNIWMGTDGGGVNIFDGRSFTYLTKKDGLPDDHAWRLAKGNKGRVWIGTNSGVAFADGMKISNLELEEENIKGTIWTLFEDSKENLWIGTYGGGLTCYFGNSYRNMASAGLNNKIVYAVSEDPSGNIWVGTDAGGANIYNGVFFTYLTVSNGLTHDRVRCIYHDREGLTWLGTDGGLAKYNQKAFLRYSRRDGLSDNRVLSISSWKESQEIWAGTFAGGIDRISFSEKNKEVISKVENYNVKHGLPSERVWKLFFDSQDRLWAGTTEGLALFDGKRFRSYNGKDGLPNNSVFVIYEDDKGTMWIGTDGGLSSFDGKKFTNYGKEQGLSHTRVRSMISDGHLGYWVSTYAGGINHFDGNKFTPLTSDPELSQATVYCQVLDDKGLLWFGTYGNGVVCYDPAAKGTGKEFTYFRITDGMGSNAILSLDIDQNQLLWVGTNAGIDVIELEHFHGSGSKVIRHYGKREGFSGIEGHQNAIYTDRSNTTWYGTINGLIRQQKSSRPADEPAPFTLITAVKLFYGELEPAPWCDSIDRKTGIPSGLVLPYDKNNLSFEFRGIRLSNPYKIWFRFKLEGFESEWSPPQVSNTVTYSNLPPGSYTFRVMSSSEKERWDTEPVTYSFRITAPIWMQWWFYAAAVALTAGSVRLLFLYRTRKIRQDNLILDRLVKEQTGELVRKNQEKEILLKEIHHRVKNNLQLISSLLNLQAGTITDKKTLEVLTECRNRVITMSVIHRKLYQSDTLSDIDVHEYLAELISFIQDSYSDPEKEIHYDIDAKGIRMDIDTTIPVGLIVNELVSNSNKYAFAGRSSGSIRLRFTEKDGVRTLIYSDDGPGLPADFNFRECSTLGLMLVQLLTDQLKGEMKYRTHEGARFEIRF